MKRLLKHIIYTAILLATAGMIYAAQPAPYGPPPGGPMGNPADFAAFQKEHRYALQLMKLAGNIGRLEESGKSALTKTQAKKVLGVLQPLRKLKTLDETSAKKGIKALQGILTDKQRTAISALPAEHKFRQGVPPSSGMRPSGPRPAGPPPSQNSNAMKNFNPLNPKSGMHMGHRSPDRMYKLFDDLKKKSSK